MKLLKFNKKTAGAAVAAVLGVIGVFVVLDAEIVAALQVLLTAVLGG